MINIKTAQNTAAIAEALYKKLQKMQYNTQHPLTVAISGGSTPKSIFSYWTNNYPQSSLWNQVVFFWVDERCVLPTDDESNFGEMRRLFFDHVDVPFGHIHRIRGEENSNDALRMYNELLQRHLPIVNGFPQFDIIWLGMGTDGHTASIFPGNEQLFDSTDWCAVAQHPQTGQKRITLTGSVICNAKNIIVVATGGDKAELIKDVTQQTGSWMKYPISRVAPKRGRMCWMIDEKAAALLNHESVKNECF